jgi:hypothetical protein
MEATVSRSSRLRLQGWRVIQASVKQAAGKAFACCLPTSIDIQLTTRRYIPEDW